MSEQNNKEKASASTAETVSFTAFILSLSTAALQALGVETHQKNTQKPTLNLPLAQQTIDILSMLQQKTKGNLTDTESTLLGNILYDMRMRYVEKSHKKS